MLGLSMPGASDDLRILARTDNEALRTKVAGSRCGGRRSNWDWTDRKVRTNPIFYENALGPKLHTTAYI